MSLLVDNANKLYLLMGIVAAGFVIAWWLTRQGKQLGVAAGVLALIAFLFLLTRFVISDARQIEMNVHAMSDALVERRPDDIFKHVAKDFKYKALDRDTLHQRAKTAVENNRVRAVRITKFQLEKLSRVKKEATASFRVTAWGANSENPYLFGAEADFVLEGDRWMLKTLRFYNPLVNQNQEFDLPGIH